MGERGRGQALTAVPPASARPQWRPCATRLRFCAEQRSLHLPDQILITQSSGERRIVPVHGAEVLFGSGADAHIRVAANGIEARHLRFVRTKQGVRVEAVRAGASVAVNGQALFCKDLQRDDVIVVGPVELRWLPAEEPPPAPAPQRSKVARGAAKSRGSAGGRGGSREESVSSRRPRRSGAPHALIAVGILLVSVIALFVVIRVFADRPLHGDPQNYVDLAREQLQNQQPQRALDTLSVALRDATGETKAEAQRLDAEIRRMLVDTAAASKVVAARQEQELLQNYVTTYLSAKGERSAARELIRLCDDWLARNRDACSRHSDGQSLVRTVEDLRGRFVTVAAIAEPDTAADATFAARTRLRFQWRDYRGAVARLDAFLAANPGSEEARAERAKVVAEGQEWVTKKLRGIDSLLSRGDTANAEKDLASLERWSVLPEWSAMVAERRQRLGPPK